MNVETLTQTLLAPAALILGLAVTSTAAHAQISPLTQALIDQSNAVLAQSNHLMEDTIRFRCAQLGIDYRSIASWPLERQIAYVNGFTARPRVSCSQARYQAQRYRSIAESASRLCQTGSSAASTASCNTASQAASQAAYYESLAAGCQ